ncbi:class I SAM-dependent methyltransferase [Bavariicoccus seileri]|uniref:class I SAM-dependent methyltransferase n=1 Tax=Bavariicoccus seileri TaxID=549685 RepID=UPI003F92EC87
MDERESPGRVYEESIYPMMDDVFVDPTVSKLAELSFGKDVLELGVGTGRIALPLANKGYRVTGVDHDSELLAWLKEKDDKHLVTSFLSDMVTIRLDQQFDLIYSIMNTFAFLESIERQKRCLVTIQKHLKPKGRVVIEMPLPTFARRKANQPIITSVFESSTEYLGFDRYQRKEQRIESFQFAFQLSREHFEVVESDHKTLHYLWPKQLEKMAEAVGLTPITVLKNWEGRPIDETANSFIMIMENKK